MTKNAATGAVILPFAQKADFYLRRGDARLEEGDLPEALMLCRKAADLEQSNALAWLRLADIYTDMGCYALSNRTLLGMTWRCQELPENYFYLLGCNYVGLQSYELALECFQRYATDMEERGNSPEAEEVAQLLTAIELSGPEGMFPDGDATENGARIIAMHGERVLQRGDYDGAITLLEHAYEMVPQLNEITTTLALAYWSKGDYAKAKKLCEEALAKKSYNAKAYCLLALIGNATGDKTLIARNVKSLMMIDFETEEDVYHAAMTLGEVGEHKIARGLLVQSVQDNPYNIWVLQASASNAYTLRCAAEAENYWSMLHKMMPDNAVVTYYMGLGAEALQGNWKKDTVPYSLQLPKDETAARIKRIKRLNTAYQDATYNGRVKPDKKVIETLLWGLQYGEEYIQAMCIAMLPKIDPKNAERLLRDYLLDDMSCEENKDNAITALHRLGVGGTFVTVTENGILEVSVGEAPDWDELPAGYRVVVQTLYTSLVPRGEEEVAGRALALWKAYIDAAGEPLPSIRKPENYAAALEYSAKKMMDLPITQRFVCRMYNASLSGMRNALELIDNVRQKMPYAKHHADENKVENEN